MSYHSWSATRGQIARMLGIGEGKVRRVLKALSAPKKCAKRLSGESMSAMERRIESEGQSAHC